MEDYGKWPFGNIGLRTMLLYGSIRSIHAYVINQVVESFIVPLLVECFIIISTY